MCGASQSPTGTQPTQAWGAAESGAWWCSIDFACAAGAKSWQDGIAAAGPETNSERRISSVRSTPSHIGAFGTRRNHRELPRFAPDMRDAFLAVLTLVAACSGGGSGNNSSAQAPAPKPTGPAPMTPITGVSPVPGRTPTWMGARDDAGDPKTAPYGNLLQQPVVNASGAAR